MLIYTIWSKTYDIDTETIIFNNRLVHNSLIDKSTISKLLASYRKIIV